MRRGQLQSSVAALAHPVKCNPLKSDMYSRSCIRERAAVSFVVRRDSDRGRSATRRRLGHVRRHRGRLVGGVPSAEVRRRRDVEQWRDNAVRRDSCGGRGRGGGDSRRRRRRHRRRRQVPVQVQSSWSSCRR